MFSVLRHNPRFRRLWTAQVVSQLGDWFNRVAIVTLIGTLAGSNAVVGFGLMLGFEMALRLLPATFLGSIAGPIADRVSRRALMIGADLGRAAVVLCLLFVRDADHLPLLYFLLFLQMAIGIFFEAARSAATPGTVRREDLHAAYTLSSATWSMMLTIGALTGGICVQLLGTRGVFILDAATYLLSATLLIGLKLPPIPNHPQPLRWRDVVMMRDIRRGLRHVRDLRITPIVFTKACWGAAGGFLTILAIAGRSRFGNLDGEAAADISTATSVGLATGLLYAARGFGTTIGPILARRFIGSDDRALKKQITAGFLVAALGYFLFSFQALLPAAMLCVALAHTGGSTTWVASTTYWQRHIDDAFRGRVYAMELMGMTFAASMGGLLAGLVFDTTGSLDITVWVTCSTVVLGCIAWSILARDIAIDTRADQSPAGAPASKSHDVESPFDPTQRHD